MAKQLGAHVATTASTANVDLVKRLGADVVVDYKKQSFETVLHGYALVLDSLGGETLEKSLDVLKPGGKVISVSGPPDAAFARELGANPIIRLVMSALSYRTRRRARQRNVTYSFLFMKASGDQLRELTPPIEAGRIRPVVDTVFPFESTRRNTPPLIDHGLPRARTTASPATRSALKPTTEGPGHDHTAESPVPLDVVLQERADPFRVRSRRGLRLPGARPR